MKTITLTTMEENVLRHMLSEFELAAEAGFDRSQVNEELESAATALSEKLNGTRPANVEELVYENTFFPGAELTDHDRATIVLTAPARMADDMMWAMDGGTPLVKVLDRWMKKECSFERKGARK